MDDSQEKVMVDERSNFFYLLRGVRRTPRGSKVRVELLRTLTMGGDTVVGLSYAIKRCDSDACIAFSTNSDDLLLFIVEHDWWIDGPPELLELFSELKR